MSRNEGPREWDFGWHPDPEHPGQERYWNGTEWTQRRPAQPVEAVAPATVERDEDRYRPAMRWVAAIAVAVVAVVVIVMIVVLIARGDGATGMSATSATSA